MNKEDKEYKFSIPLITNIELEQIDKYQDKLINELYKHIYNVKELIILQTIICNQEKTIKEQEKTIKEQEKIINRAIEYLAIDDETMNVCTMYDVNGIDLMKILNGDDIDE